jgi:predicted HTH domain antitoxin
MNILVNMDFPSEVEQQLATERERLSAVAQEAIAIELFRKGLLSHAQLSQALDLDRFETEALLKRYQVTEHALTHAEVDAEVERLNQWIGPTVP